MKSGKGRKYQFWTSDNWDNAATDKKGRKRVYRPDYPGYTNKDGMAMRSHIVYWLVTGEVIKNPYCLHHIDEDCSNDVYQNLQKLTRAEHARLHRKKNDIGVLCDNCKRFFFLKRWEIKNRLGKSKDGNLFCSHKCSAEVKWHGIKELCI